ncbi:hypothetical protein D8B26_000530 [Coccidioides posadasii str. Silveira]|uniref:uncharacterized protein n=1 Tax=Coccidioides posadasii (strain RMSCC 757 / Silveira) TaxID=443226 RepID=UPI001BEE7EEE|nr:hypothetical protein D8B26_000530 [Coccidioides posadasii str. Silveira]
MICSYILQGYRLDMVTLQFSTLCEALSSHSRFLEECRQENDSIHSISVLIWFTFPLRGNNDFRAPNPPNQQKKKKEKKKKREKKKRKGASLSDLSLVLL